MIWGAVLDKAAEEPQSHYANRNSQYVQREAAKATRQADTKVATKEKLLTIRLGVTPSTNDKHLVQHSPKEQQALKRIQSKSAQDKWDEQANNENTPHSTNMQKQHQLNGAPNEHGINTRSSTL